VRILFFDVETSGLPNFNERARHPSQPHLVQFASIYRDGSGVDEIYSQIIKPDGWIIPDDVAEIHGITTERAIAEGIPEAEVAGYFLSKMKEVDLMVAHNDTFDRFLMRIACRRFDLITDDDDLWWKQFPRFCTMRAMENICKLPGKFAGKYKWPKLTEAYQHAFGRPLEDAHDALADVRACAEIYFWLQNQNKQT
jgi:DNA polymerase-3 subunit epsilon